MFYQIKIKVTYPEQMSLYETTVFYTLFYTEYLRSFTKLHVQKFDINGLA
jgi:hypothetical protein